MITAPDGTDLGPSITAAAQATKVDAVTLLALLYAESRCDPQAERWGAWTMSAKMCIATHNLAGLAAIIAKAAPDISFGPGQQTVRYAPWGDQTESVTNCLAVRQYVFEHTAEAILYAAQTLADCYQRTLNDGRQSLRALVCYNSGGDNLDTGWYQMEYQSNIANYTAALAWAQTHAGDLALGEDMVDRDALTAALTTIYAVRQSIGGDAPVIVPRLRQYAQELRTLGQGNYAEALEATANELQDDAQQLFDAVVQAKVAAGLQ